MFSSRFFHNGCTICKSILCISVFCLAVLSSLQSVAAPIPRDILVLYSEEDGQSAAENNWRRGFDMAANHLGLISTYQDVTAPLPTSLPPEKWKAVVCLLRSNSLKDPSALLDWLIKRAESGVKTIFIGHPGSLAFGTGSDTQAKLETLLALHGLSYTTSQTASGGQLEYGQNVKSMNLERPLPILPPRYETYAIADKTKVTPWLTVRHKKTQQEAVAVAVTSKGGIILPEYVYWEDPVNFKAQLYVDPFAFLTEALDIATMPAPTPTTLNGNRVAFSHIDADGFTGFTNVNKKKNCAWVMYDEVLRKTDFPITVSVITAEVDPRYAGRDDYLELAKAIFALDNIEPASHSFSHPFYWDPNDTAKAKLFQDKFELTQYGFPIDGYVFNERTETVDSINWISRNLAPKNKPCKVMLWSGSCDPKPFVMEPLEKAGFLNMNGGDTIYDNLNNSLTTVSPLVKRVGPYLQIFTGQANENILTNLWEGPYHAYRYITRTMENTESPRRLKPIDAYYHFYSAEYEASLQAVKDVYAWIQKQQTAPVFTSDYIKMANSYASLSMEREGLTDIISNYGDCLTIRYDDTNIIPDLRQSKNILGYSVLPQGTFVHLVPGKAEARIVRTTAKILALNAVTKAPAAFSASSTKGKVATDIPQPNTQTQAEPPHLRSASGWVSNFSVIASNIKLTFKCFNAGTITIGGMQPERSYVVKATWTAHAQPTKTLVANTKGELFINDIASGTVEIIRQ